MVHAVCHADQIQKLFGSLRAFFLRNSCIHHRKLDILARIGSGNEVEVLEHEADFAVPDLREFVILRILHIGAVEPVGSLGRAVEHADHVHQRRFSGAGRADNRDELSLLHVQINPMQNFQLVRLPDIEAFDNAAHPDQLSASH